MIAIDLIFLLSLFLLIGALNCFIGYLLGRGLSKLSHLMTLKDEGSKWDQYCGDPNCPMHGQDP